MARWLDAAGLDGVEPAGRLLHARTGGNPLFISESIQLLGAGSRPDAPLRSVGEVIRERLAPLPPGCREVLEMASVLGRDFEYPPARRGPGRSARRPRSRPWTPRSTPG